jgi:hypothetical protein
VARVSYSESERARAVTLADARARDCLAIVLQALAEQGTAAKLASAAGVSESTVSRWKTERLEESVQLLSHLGFRVISADDKVLDPKAYDFLVSAVIKAMQTAPGLILGVQQ